MGEQGIPIIGPILNKIIGSRNERFVKRYTMRVQAINALETQMHGLSDADLRGKLGELRARREKGTATDDLLVDAFAVAREAMDRAVGIRNVFNPKAGFDPSALPAAARAIYDKVKAEMDAREPAPGIGEWQGCSELVPGWQQVDIPAEFYEAVRALYPESRPPFRARPFDVQLIGAMVLAQGKIAEMKTGEGKTIVAPLACYLASIERQRVHVVTVNDYLVQRDRDWTFPFFHALGMTVGAIHPQHMQDEDTKRVMYRCDVVYGTTAEFGFDYLRDNMKRTAEQQVQRRREFAIVDEVDSILIDEARTPLIISGHAHEDVPRYELADKLARHLVEKQKPWTQADKAVQQCRMRIKGLEGDIRQARDKGKIPQLQEELKQAKAQLPQLEAACKGLTQYFEVKEDRKQALLTHEGVSEAQRVAQVGSFYIEQNMDLPHLLEQSLRAHTIYELDKDYIVMTAPDPQMGGRPTPSVVIVDVNTGRPMVGRQWSDGLHQAVECKERVPIKQETQTVATITIQNFFKMYKRLAGMTGTADTEAQEFNDIYKLDVVSIPTNKAITRRDFDDMVFLTGKDKWSHIVDEIKAFHDAGRPILVGTTSVEKSELVSKLLTQRHGIVHEVLNAKQHEREAHIVENAGQIGSVMIATNMAGRGTDIKLGKLTREKLLEHWLKRGLAPRTLTVDADEKTLREQIYRKVAPQELDVPKRDLEGVAFEELEVRLLRHWAAKHTWASPKQIEKASADELRKLLDDSGRFLLHNLRWYEDVEDIGGLHVIGTERHESRRIDNQLRGRSGRQGDNGSSRFFVALDDDLMRMFAGETTLRFLSRIGMKEGDAIEHPMLSRSVANAQKKVEERNFHHRKNILEYDEVMEHQRQKFYGMRQRAIEGRDVKGLIFELIAQTVDDACEMYLDPDYPTQCAAEFARARLECSIEPGRLKGKSLLEMERTILGDAEQDARQSVSITLGEYMPMEGSEVAIDFDAAGLANWAKTRFGVEIDPAQLRSGGADEREHVRDLLTHAAVKKIRGADLEGLAQFTQANYGANELAKWAADKLSIEVGVDEILAAIKTDDEDEMASPASLLMAKVREQYERREIEYPVEFQMQYTTLLMRQSPADAATNLLNWANTRYRLGWTPEIFKTSTPQKVREMLLKASEEYVKSGRLEQDIEAAMAQPDDNAFDAFLRERYGVGLPESLRYREGQERIDMVRARIENIVRSELLHFERTIMIDTMDGEWKDHLYAMDQLRDSISYRAFSQQDPRIEYKREGSHLFTAMMERLRERVTEFVFKATIVPSLPPQRPAPQQPPRPPSNRPPAGMGGGVGGITGPGLDTSGGMLA